MGASWPGVSEGEGRGLMLANRAWRSLGVDISVTRHSEDDLQAISKLQRTFHELSFESQKRRVSSRAWSDKE